MSIPVDEWKKLIQGSLVRLSDGEYQRLAWFNKHVEETSPDEQISQILGDYNFDVFIRSPQIGLSAQQKTDALELVSRLKRFGGNSRYPHNPFDVINDPEWRAIQAHSKRVQLALFPNSEPA